MLSGQGGLHNGRSDKSTNGKFITNLRINEFADSYIRTQLSFVDAIMFSSKLIIGLLIFILVVHVLATINHWYWTYRWFDMPMHFLGGFWVAIVFLSLDSKFKILNSKFLVNVILILGFAALVGVLWEFFEFLLDAFLSKDGYSGSFQVLRYGVKDLYTDTLSDLFFDLLGGLTMAAIFQFRKSKNRFPKDNKPDSV